MPNDAAAEKPGSTEHGDGALVRDRHGPTSLPPSTPRSVTNDNVSAPQAMESRCRLLRCMSPLLAQSGHPQLHRTCPLSGVKRTLIPAIGNLSCAFARWVGGMGYNARN